MTEFVNVPGTKLQPQAVVFMNPTTGAPYASVPVTLSGESLTVSVPAAVEINNDAGNPIPVSGPVTDTQLRASALPIAAQSRTCLGTQMLTALSASTAASLTVPDGAVCADIQADGGTVRMRRDATAPTATQGWRIDDGMSVTVDSVLASVRLLAVAGTTTNVQICFYDRV